MQHATCHIWMLCNLIIVESCDRNQNQTCNDFCAGRFFFFATGFKYDTATATAAALVFHALLHFSMWIKFVRTRFQQLLECYFGCFSPCDQYEAATWADSININIDTFVVAFLLTFYLKIACLRTHTHTYCNL